MHSPPATPLDQAKLDRLDEWPDAAAWPITTVEALAGFPVAALLSPDLVLPSQYLHLLFDADADARWSSSSWRRPRKP